MTNEDHVLFHEAVRGLLAGDFSRLTPLFDLPPGGSSYPIIEWHEAGLFAGEPGALAEAFTCACFLGRERVVKYFLEKGVNPSGGVKTGLDAFHWAANRGQVDVVRILIQCKASLETRSMHGSTVLGTAVWSAINEPRAEHMKVIAALIDAGAQVKVAGYPTGNERVDEVLRRHIGPT